MDPAKPVGDDLAHDFRRCKVLKVCWQSTMISVEFKSQCLNVSILGPSLLPRLYTSTIDVEFDAGRAFRLNI